MACKWVRFAYRLLPLSPWRAFWLTRHIDHCPLCRADALDDEAIRSLGVTAAGLLNEPPLRPFAVGTRPAPRGRAFRLSYVYGAFLAVVAVGAVFVMSRLVPPVAAAQGIVTVMEDGGDARVFAVLEAQIGGEPVRPVVFKPGPSGMTIVWFEKNCN